MTEETESGSGRGSAGVEELREHLRHSTPVPPVDEVAWDDLARTIEARAEPLLLARRRRLPWWRHTSRWARAGIPLAAAAVLALALLVPRVGPAGTRLDAVSTGLVPALTEAGAGVASTGASTDPLLAFLSASDDGETLLMSALEEE